jgi:hypothetical protein
MKRIGTLAVAAMLLLSLCGCSTFEDTPETEAAFAAYEAAVLQTVEHKQGKITVVTENKDTAIENKETLGVIEYTFSTDEANKVTFERNDYTDGLHVASYKADGESIWQMDMESETWSDVTEESAAMLNHDTNYMNTLSLFRIDNGFRYSKQFFESVTLAQEGGEKVVTFTLKNKAITDMLEFSDVRGIKRKMSSQTRSFYINEKGDIYKIVLDTVQDIKYQGKEGMLSTKITVTTEYE